MEKTHKSNLREDWKRLKRALALAAPKKKNVLLIVFLTLIVVAAGVAEPLIMKFIIDRLTGDLDASRLINGILLLLAIAVFREIVAAFSNWLTWRTRIRIHHNLLRITVGRLHILPVDFHRSQGSGAIMTKLERGIQGYVKAVSEIAFNVFPAIAYLSMALVVMLRLDLRMTLLIVIFTPLPALVANMAAPHQRSRETFLMGRWAKIYSRFNEVLSGIVTVRSFAMEDYEKNRFMKNVEEANERVVKGVGYDSRITAIQNTIVVFARVSAIAFGTFLIISGDITLGTLVAYLGYIGGLFGPVQSLTGIYTTFQMATVSLEHIFEILDKQDFLGDSPDAVEPQEIKGEIMYQNVHFSYEVSGTKIIHDFNLHVKPGESIAFVGPSGSGKTTLIALLQRFYDPSEGDVFIDGYNLKMLKQISLRRQMGVVMQDALLFNESVFENIRYGKQDASFDEVVQAAKAANVHEFIMTLPEGYETQAGERGGRLSGGERQRIAIARAILKDPPILILDEASSAMDAELEAMVQEALLKLMHGRTTFIIAHRLNTVVNANQIVVLQKGRIIEKGTHSELMKANGYYALLVKRQTHGLLNM